MIIRHKPKNYAIISYLYNAPLSPSFAKLHKIKRLSLADILSSDFKMFPSCTGQLSNNPPTLHRKELPCHVSIGCNYSLLLYDKDHTKTYHLQTCSLRHNYHQLCAIVKKQKLLCLTFETVIIS